MILADRSVWIDHFRHFDPSPDTILRSQTIAKHPFVVAELGSLRERGKTLADLEKLQQLKVANFAEVRVLIESNFLYSKGIRSIDASLAASCLIEPGTKLWTRDAALRNVAQSLNILAGIH